MKPLIGLLVISLIGIAGCSNDKKKDDESLAKQAGSKVGETLTEFASGVGKGVDKQMAVDVELAKPLVDAGISKTVAKLTAAAPGNARALSVYLVASRPFKAKLLAKALDADGREIGRATADVEFTADDAKYVSFAFDRQMDSQLVKKYVIDAKK
jgi:hypothetical protein